MCLNVCSEHKRRLHLAAYRSLPLSGYLLHLTNKDITLLKNSPIKIFVDHLQGQKFFRLNNFELKILRGEFFQNYGSYNRFTVSLEVS